MGLGLAALGRPGYITLKREEDLGTLHSAEDWEQHTHNMLAEAWRLGIRYFDAARSYGRAEKFLGDWLREQQAPEQQVVVGSKWGYTYTANWQKQANQHEIKNHSLPQLEKQREESNLLLGSYLKIYYIHSATLESGVLDNKLVLERLYTLKNTGLTIGLSVSGTGQAETIEKALEIKFDDTYLFSVVQATYNILETSAEQALKKAAQAGWGIIIKEGMANGRLSLRAPQDEQSTLLDSINTISREANISPDAVALAYIAQQNWVHVVLSGAVTTDQLRHNIKAMENPLNSKHMNLLSGLAESPENYWKNRKELPWN